MNRLISLIREYRETAAIKAFRRQLAIVRTVEEQQLITAVEAQVAAWEAELQEVQK